jgi:hypothetical protein
MGVTKLQSEKYVGDALTLSTAGAEHEPMIRPFAPVSVMSP